jgi:hypothetical protein
MHLDILASALLLQLLAQLGELQLLGFDPGVERLDQRISIVGRGRPGLRLQSCGRLRCRGCLLHRRGSRKGRLDGLSRGRGYGLGRPDRLGLARRGTFLRGLGRRAELDGFRKRLCGLGGGRVLEGDRRRSLRYELRRRGTFLHGLGRRAQLDRLGQRL